MTQAFTQGEHNLVIDPIEISSDTSLSLPETLSLPSTPSTINQNPTTTFPLNFSTNLDDRYRELLTNNIPLRLDWRKLVTLLPYSVNIVIATEYTIDSTYTINQVFYLHESLDNIPDSNTESEISFIQPQTKRHWNYYQKIKT